jgi:hypothetical protein
MIDHAHVVIIGVVADWSSAYHLSQRGGRDLLAAILL